MFNFESEFAYNEDSFVWIIYFGIHASTAELNCQGRLLKARTIFGLESSIYGNRNRSLKFMNSATTWLNFIKLPIWTCPKQKPHFLSKLRTFSVINKQLIKIEKLKLNLEKFQMWTWFCTFWETLPYCYPINYFLAR